MFIVIVQGLVSPGVVLFFIAKNCLNMILKSLVVLFIQALLIITT